MARYHNSPVLSIDFLSRVNHSSLETHQLNNVETKVTWESEKSFKRESSNHCRARTQKRSEEVEWPIRMGEWALRGWSVRSVSENPDDSHHGEDDEKAVEEKMSQRWPHHVDTEFSNNQNTERRGPGRALLLWHFTSRDDSSRHRDGAECVCTMRLCKNYFIARKFWFWRKTKIFHSPTKVARKCATVRLTTRDSLFTSLIALVDIFTCNLCIEIWPQFSIFRSEPRSTPLIPDEIVFADNSPDSSLYGSEDEEQEDVSQYRRGGKTFIVIAELFHWHIYNFPGYHPIHLGDILHNRYRVVRKVGWGHFSTVWLCRDLDEEKYVALKVVKSAQHYTETAADEIRLLEVIRDADPFDRHHERIVKLLNHFTVQGVNGVHTCLVFEALGCSLYKLIVKNNYQGLGLRQVKSIIKQVK